MVLRLLTVLACVAAAFGQQPEAEKFYEELIRTPIVPQRTRADIQADVKAVEQAQKQLDKTISDYRARIKESDGWVAIQKAEIAELSKKAKLAKKDKRTADKLELDAQRKQLELVEDYLKRISRVREMELAVAQARKDLLNNETRVYEAELDSNKKVAAMRKGQATDPNFVKTTLEAVQAGEQTLTLMKQLADKNTDVAGRMKQLADRRVALVKARNQLLSEQRIRSAAGKVGQR